MCTFIHTLLLLSIVRPIDDTVFSNPTILFASFLRLPDIKFNFIKRRRLKCKTICECNVLPVHNPTIFPEDLSYALMSV